MRNRLLIVTAALALCSSVAAAQTVQIRRTMSEHRGYLGIRYDETVNQQNGVTNDKIVIREVSKDSPAEKAGLKVGDEILRINGLNAANGKFSAIAGTLTQGDTVRLTVRRENKDREFTIVAAERPMGMYGFNEITIAPDSVKRLMLRYLDSARVHLDSLHLPSIRIMRGDSSFNIMIPPFALRDSLMKNDTAAFRVFRGNAGTFERMLPRGRLEDIGPNMVFRSYELGSRAIGGAELTVLDPSMVDYFKTDKGLLVLHVAPESPAERAGLQPGDVIVKAKDRAITRVDDLRAIVAANAESVKLEILRKGARKSLEIKTRR